MKSLIPFVLVVIVAVAAFALYWSVRWRRKRAEAMRQVALTLGLSSLDDEGKSPLPPSVLQLPLMTRGHSRKATNVLSGSLDGEAVLLFDYRYVTGAGKSQQVHRHTVATFPESGAGLPDFELAPENILSRLAQAFGYHDIDFPEDHAFSKLFLLRGSDETAIRNAFNSELRSLLCEKPGWCVQARAGAVAVFRSRGIWAAEDVPSELTEARRMLGALAR